MEDNEVRFIRLVITSMVQMCLILPSTLMAESLNALRPVLYIEDENLARFASAVGLGSGPIKSLAGAAPH